MDGYTKLTRDGLRSVFMEVIRVGVESGYITEENYHPVMSAMKSAYQGLVVLNDELVDQINQAGGNPIAMAIAKMVFSDPDTNIMDEMGISQE